MAGTELAIPDYAGEIERSDDPATRVVAMCEQVRRDLAHLIEDGDLGRIVELRSVAEAVRVYTLSKQLGQEAQLAATELVRRAERGIAVAIRRGQEAGEIKKRGDRDLAANHAISAISKPSPTDYASQGELSSNGAGIYRMADGVTDEQFEDAITEAKAEGNLSRANVVRKVHKEDAPVTLSRAEARRRSAPGGGTVASAA